MTPATEGDEIGGVEKSVAVIGAACRFPGAKNLDEFWDLLLAGRDAVGEIPEQRFDARKLHSQKPGQPKRIRSLSGGFLDGIEYFDASFFGISPSEAEQMDPQQRLLLELVWHAIEDAGQTAENLAGSNTGVYVTTFSSAYWDQLRAAGHTGLHAAMGSEMGGETGGVIAGRISYQLDLRGPSMAVSSTCATPLVAVNLAVQALRSGEIDLAIVGGASLLLSSDMYVAMSEAEMLSPNGRCRFGDVQADGFVRSEGAGVVILKRLADAVRDGDRGYAAIVGAATRNNGRSGGSLTTQGRAGQEATLRAAYQDAGIPPGIVDYVEAHGAGTPGGDPVELEALGAVLGQGRPADRPCLVGSVKSNLGHLEGVAGFAGLIKAALVLWHRTVPVSLHVTVPAPALARPEAPLRVVDRAHRLPSGGPPPVVGVSAFGLSGTTAHIVLSGLAGARSPGGPGERTGYLIPISARHGEALRVLGERYAEMLGGRDSPSLADVCHTAGVRRTHFERRVAVVGTNRAELVDGLAGIAAGRRTEHVIGDGREVTGPPRIVFVYSGQGSQWAGMARTLLEENRTFATYLAECDRAIRSEVGWSAIEHLLRCDRLSTMDRVQPVLWAVQVALAALWRDWGVEPDLVIGHSMGEVGAAVTAGALTIADGAAVICRRSALLAARRSPGVMWSVQLGERAAWQAIGGHAGKVSVGVVNSRMSTVLSGDPVALTEIIGTLRERGVFCRQVPVDYASHAPQVEPMRQLLRDELADLSPLSGRVPIHSTVSDRVVDGSGFDGSYWSDNLILPVRFESAVRATLADRRRPTLLVEISPHPILHSALMDGIEDAGADATPVSSLRRGDPELATMLAGLGTVYAHGGRPAWERVNPGGRFVGVPSYPWQRKRFWVAGGSGTEGDGWTDQPAGAGDSRALFDPRHHAELAAAAETVQGRVRYLRRCVSGLLGMSDVDPSVPLTSQGFDSVFAVRLAYQIRTELGLEVNSRDVLCVQSIEDLARELRPRRRTAVS